jgi:hypothetical protein
MLSGRTFGDAVKRARAVTHAAHLTSNTWGAYQCYGDPGYVLVRDGAARATGTDCTFRSPSHAASELDNRLRSMRRDEDLSQHQAYLQRARDWLTARGWLDDSQVSSALAAALAEAGDSAAAVELFERAFKAKDGLIRLRDIEQYANVLARGDQRQDPQTWSRDIDKAVELLRWSMHANGSPLHEWTGRTPERLCLLGSAYKRKAALLLRATLATTPNAPDLTRVAGTLELMRDAYRAAWQLDSDKPDAYAVTNYLIAATLAALATGQLADLASIREESRAVLPECRSALRESAAAQPEFWSGAALHDCDVIEALVSGQTLDDAALSQKVEQLLMGYTDARLRARPRDFDSVLYQFEWLNEMVRTFDGNRRHTGSFCDILARLTLALNTAS